MRIHLRQIIEDPPSENKLIPARGVVQKIDLLVAKQMNMPYHLFADFVVVIHFSFVLFSVLGALLVIWWRKILYVHLPAAVWAAWIEFSGRICPLTPLENWLRLKGGEAGYGGDFVGHYLLSVLYPAGLTRNVQLVLGGVVVGLNMIIYGYILIARKGRGGSM